MAAIRLSDIQINNAFLQYVIAKTATLSALMKSGIVGVDAAVAAAVKSAGFGGKMVNLPFWNDIAGDDEVLSDDPSAPLTAGGINSGQDVAVILRRGRLFSSSDLNAEIAGNDPMMVLGDLIAEYWARRKQAAVFATLQGIFASNAANNDGDLILDISGETGDDAILGKDTLLYAAQLLGDAKGALTAVAMHSQAETLLNTLGGTGSLYKPAETAAQLPSYNGRPIVVDDSCGYDPATQKATIYLFGQGAVAVNDAPVKTPFEMQRKIETSSDQMATRAGFIAHVRGFKFLNVGVTTPTPTNVNLASANNWERVYEKKQVRVVKLVAKLG